MWNVRTLVLAGALVGCKSDETVVEVAGTSSATDLVKGTLSLDGAPLALGACKPGNAIHTFVEVVTAKGKLRFEDATLYWQTDPTSPQKGGRLDCEKLDRSWGGGTRRDGTSYWRGTLAFDCKLSLASRAVTVTGDLTLDCGGITAEERRQLDGNRQQLLDDQRRAAP